MIVDDYGAGAPAPRRARGRAFGGFFGSFGLITFDIPTPTSGGWDRGDEFRPYRARRDSALPRAQAVIDAAAGIPNGTPGSDAINNLFFQVQADLANEAGGIDTNWPWDAGWPVQVTRSPGRTAALQSHMRYWTDALDRLANEGGAALVEIGRIAAEAKAQAAAKAEAARQAAAAKAAADKATTEQAAREAAQRAVQAAIAAGANPKQIEAAGRAAAGAVTGYATPALAVGEGLLPTWAKAALVAAFGGGALYFILRRPRAN